MPLTDIDGARLDDSALYAGKNLIINGAMQVAQRGTTSTSSGYQTADRWINQFSGGAVTQSQQSLSSGDPYNEGFRHFLRLANTTSSTASSSYRDIATRVEAQNVAQSGWQYTSSTSYITVSFWARSSVAQTYYLNLQSEDGTKQTYPASFALSADTWTKVTKTIPGNSSITINNDNGVGMYVSIIPFFGTDYTDSGVTDNAWNARATGTQLPDMTNTWAGTTNATFDVTGVQLEVGASASAFEHRSYADELRRCQRYYIDVLAGKASNNTTICIGAQYNSSTAFGTIHLPVQMRTGPAIEVSNSSAYYRLYVNSSDISVSTFLLDSSSNARAVEIEASASGTGGHAVMFRTKNSAAILRLTAEL